MFFSEMETSRNGHGNDTGRYADRLPAATADLPELQRRERRERVERALRGLPDHQRVPLVLFHFDEMSYEQIAGVLGVSLGKVKNDIHRGRLSLRKELSR